ncbi:hypothetical protein [Rhodopseudomonas pseudopalustris]|uniref:Uncharacterized protein n=2 Tax=Rhodopseudomonas pseudopalustris TaxID=1513892 RepID=A0A1H8SRE4_9BRAD|nr:hypothetical protein [Rhodopseudomonas pseudopalustris]SEO80723.1 hypothetical protein SAMN05444123_10517 [Rhodopseudomonas pseudopalustris]
MLRKSRRPIRSAALMLDMMREHMPSILISDVDGRYFIAQFDLSDIDRFPTFIAEVKVMSEAGRLIDDAFGACVEEDEEKFFALPLRFGPTATTWVLAEASYAPGMIDDESGTDQRALFLPFYGRGGNTD